LNSIAVVVPTLNEADQIGPCLARVQRFLRVKIDQLVVVDAGSLDNTVEQALAFGARVIVAQAGQRGRAQQMNLGAASVDADWILFLHADTLMPEMGAQDFVDLVNAKIESASNATPIWGRFDLQFSAEHRSLKVVAWMMNARSRLTGICTGDQAIFVTQDSFRAIGGYPQQDLMEDIELSRRLKRFGGPVCLAPKVTTSARKWLKNGVWRTIGLMWCLRFAYWAGVSPQRLNAWYYR
jgi:rSAM/selenodomain-associated transferase 2